MKLAFPFLLFAVILTSGCGPSVRVSGSWANEPALKSQAYQKIFLAALTQNMEAKMTVEEDMKVALERSGVEVVPSSQVFPPKFKPTKENKEEILQAIRATGVDAIMTLAVVDTRSETYYVPGTTTYMPTAYPYYGNYWGYYGYTYARVSEPGYYATENTMYLEANLYDANSEELLWSAQSEAYNPTNVKSFSKAYVNSLVADMKKKGLLR